MKQRLSQITKIIHDLLKLGFLLQLKFIYIDYTLYDDNTTFCMCFVIIQYTSVVVLKKLFGFKVKN